MFERVNQRGVELDTVQLLSAWTWSSDFDLNQKFEELADELAPFGFKDIAKDKDLLLRCCSAVLTKDSSAEALVKLNGSVVRNNFEIVTNGVKGAIDFVRKNLHVEALANLPYENLLVPLSVFFAGETSTQHKMSDDARREIIQWFWKTCLSRRYNSQPIKNLKEDILEIAKLRAGEPSKLTQVPVSITSRIFLDNTFRINSVLSKSFILMLAQAGPRSYISGQKLNLSDVLKEYNRNEFHHIYPKSFLRLSKQPQPDDTCLANMSFMSRTDNNTLGGSAPSQYRQKMPLNVDEIIESNLLTSNTFADIYTDFTSARAERLLTYASTLMT